MCNGWVSYVMHDLISAQATVVLAIAGMIYSSLTAVRITDLKRIIAYTSVVHINLVVIGIFSLALVGLEGAILQSLSHGFVSSTLFLIVKILYDRHHTRMLKYSGGLVHLIPLFIIIRRNILSQFWTS